MARQSTLGELRSLAGFLEAILAALLGSGITAEVTFALEGLAIVRGQLTERTGRTLLDGIGLTREASPMNIDKKIVFLGKPEGLQGCHDRIEVGRVEVQVIVPGAAVDGDAP
jgi:hypothetical protein